jgi:ATP-binding cassette subfamily F protein 1
MMSPCINHQQDHVAKVFKGTLFCVSHDADFLDTVCTDVIELDSQQLVCHGGDVYRFLSGRESRTAKRAADYALQEKTIRQGQMKGLSKKVAEVKALETIKRSALVEKPREYNVDFTFKNPLDDGPTIAVLDVGFSHPKGPPLFANLRFSVGTHSRIAVVGANGTGKTTLLQLLTGQLQPTSGEVSLHRKLHLGRFDQHFEELLPRDETPVAYLRSKFDLTEHDARKALGQFGLAGPQHLIRISELSGGQKARVVFASLSQERPHVLILDEVGCRTVL